MTREELAVEFERNRPRLKSFVVRLTGSVQDTEDIVQDTFVRACEKLEQFRGDSSMKTWLFAIPANLARDNARAKRRWTEHVTDIARTAALGDPVFFGEAMQIRVQSSQGAFEIKEHIAFCFTCIAKSLPLEQHLCVLLKEVYDLTVAEISRILDTTEAMVKYYLHTARTKMMAIFEGRCSLINKQGVCHQCSELNGVFNPKQQFQEEAVRIAMVREAATAGKERLFDLRMQIVQGIDPFESGAAVLQLHHLEYNRRVMEDHLASDRRAAENLLEKPGE